MARNLTPDLVRQMMRRAISMVGVTALVLGATAGCDMTVTNPGPVRDDFLFDRNAAVALVNGSGRALATGLNWLSYTGAAVAREIHPAGSTGSFGISNRWQLGELNADDQDLNNHWDFAQRARWVAEETVRRLEAAGPPPAGSLQTVLDYNLFLQRAYLYAGYANRVLGENMCDAVIDRGPKQSNAVFFQRAESLFTKALGITGTTTAMVAQTNAAYAGRAAARVHLGKWTEAIADAALVPIGYAYNLSYFDLGEDAQRNRIFWARAGTPYRAHTQWSTWYYDYRQATNDPRVPITITTQQGDAALECCGRVPFWPEAKHNASNAPIRLASGREMLLIRAEERLRAATPDVPGAMAFINQVRTNAGTSTVTAATSTEAWRLLKRERGIELWLEGRRLGDMRRWAAASIPGALDPLEQVSASARTGSHLTRQDLCFPISRSERETNPNL